MRTILLAMSAVLAVAAVPAAAMDHTCVEVSGRVNTEPTLGDCTYEGGSLHNCTTAGSTQLRVTACLPRTFSYANTAR